MILNLFGFVVFITGRFVLSCLALCFRVFSSLAYFARVNFCPFSLPLGVGIDCACDCGIPWTYLLNFVDNLLLKFSNVQSNIYQYAKYWKNIAVPGIKPNRNCLYAVAMLEVQGDITHLSACVASVSVSSRVQKEPPGCAVSSHGVERTSAFFNIYTRSARFSIYTQSQIYKESD